MSWKGFSVEKLAQLSAQLRQHFPPLVRKAVLAAFFSMADRAVRVYAPQALENAKLVQEAAKLRALPRLEDVETAEAALRVMDAVLWVASEAAMRTGWASVTEEKWAAETTHEAWAAVWAVRTSAKEPAMLGETAVAAARAAWVVGRAKEEAAQQLVDLRAALPLEVLEAALAETTGGKPYDA